jgi:endonuclease-3
MPEHAMIAGMARETIQQKQARSLVILTLLRQLYGEARTELHYENAFQLLIAVILSAQATDVSVNLAGPKLFARFPDAAALAAAEPEEVMPFISSIGLYRSKARYLVGTARMLVSLHGGQVPRRFEELLELPGVGRKTANVVVGVLYGEPAIAVDTHVGRLARRLGLSRQTNPDKVEIDLKRVLPREQWVFAHHAFILHGRRICVARKPRCADCILKELCPSAFLFS